MQISRTRGQYSGAGVQTPPAPLTGSPMNAATLSAPSRRIAASSQWAHSPSEFGVQSHSRLSGFVARTTSGTSGPKYFQKGGSPVIEEVASVPPWYERSRAISFTLLPRPLRFQ
ncbi:MAG: hypothetical protein U0360_05290 [Dehalococcoidia bacterium]